MSEENESASPSEKIAGAASGTSSAVDAAAGTSLFGAGTTSGSSFQVTPFLEDNDIGAAVKNVFEIEKVDESVELLDKFIKDKDAEITEICNVNYQDFIQSVDELMAVRVDAMEMRNTILELQSSIKEHNESLVSGIKSLISHRQTLLRIRKSISVVSNCHYLWSMLTTVQESIEGKQFYEAWKNLRIVLSIVKSYPKYEFVSLIEKQVPVLEKQIVFNTLATCNEWLEVCFSVPFRIKFIAFAIVCQEQVERCWHKGFGNHHCKLR